MADESIALELEIALKNAQSVKELKQVLIDCKDAAIAAGEGTAAFDAITNVAGKAKDQIGDLNERINAMDPGSKAQAFHALGNTMVGGFQAATGALAVFSGDNEQLNKILLKSMALVQGLQGIQAISDAKKQLGSVAAILGLKQQVIGTAALTVATEGQAVATEGASLATKGLRTALISTGIGAIVVAVGLLIANWDKLSKAMDGNTESWQRFKQMISVTNPGIYVIIKTIELVKAKIDDMRDALSWVTGGWVDDAATHKAKVVLDERIEQMTQAKDAVDEWGKKEENHIRVMKATGQSADEVYEAERKLLVLRKSATAELINALKVKEANKSITEDQKKTLNELRVAYGSLVADIKELDKGETDRKKQVHDKEAADYKTYLDKVKSLDFQNRQFIIDNELTGRAKQLAQAQLDREKEIDALKKGYTKKEQASEAFQQRMQQIEDKYQKKVVDLNKVVDAEVLKQKTATKEVAILISGEARDKVIGDVTAEADAIKKLHEEDLANIKERIKSAIATGTEIANAYTQIRSDQIETVKNKELGAADAEVKAKIAAAGTDVKAREKAMKDYEAKKLEIEKAAFERNKKAQESTAIISGLTAILRIASDVPKFDGGITTALLIAAQIAMTANTVAKIRSTTFQSGSFSPPDLAAAGNAASANAPNVNAGGQRTTFDEAERRRQKTEQQPIFETYVVESNVTDKQKGVVVAQERAKRRVR